MAGLSIRSIVPAALLVLVLTGCATQGGQPGEDRREAAMLNLELGVGYLRQGNLDAAQDRLERAIEQDNRLALAHSALAVVYERLEDKDGAERLYRRAAQLDPQDPDVLNALAVFLCGQRDAAPEALRYFDRALSIPLSRKQVDRRVINTNAGTCARRTDAERAEAYLRAALDIDPNYADALEMMARVFMEDEQPLRARAFVERYLATGSSSAEVLWIGYRVETELGDRAAARDYADRLLAEFPGSEETRSVRRDLQGAG